MGSGTSREDRIRVSVIAAELGIEFAPLLFKFWRCCPAVVDDNLTVPKAWLRVLTYARYEAPDAA